MTVPAPPFSSIFDLNTLPDKSVEVLLSPSAAERTAIAGWVDVGAVERMEARIRIERKTADLYTYDASFDAEVVQACVVTLGPVRSHLTGTFHRAYRVQHNPRPARRKPAPESNARQIEIVYSDSGDSRDEDGPELLDTAKLDIAAPVLEELILVLDPYPRAPGAILAVPDEAKSPAANPFAVLEGLKASEPGPGSGPKPRRKD